MSPLSVAQGHPYSVAIGAVGLMLEQKATQSILRLSGAELILCPCTLCLGVRSVGLLDTQSCSVLGQLSCWLLWVSVVAFGSDHSSLTPRGTGINWLLLE